MDGAMGGAAASTEHQENPREKGARAFRTRWILDHMPLLAGVHRETLRALIEGAVHRAIGRRSRLIEEGSRADSIAMVGRGRLRVSRIYAGEHVVGLGYRGPGDLVGEAAIGGISHHKETAVALEDVEAVLVPVTLVRTLAAADPGFSAALLGVLLERAADAEERFAALRYRNVDVRLADFLVKASKRWGIPNPAGILISAPLTHQDISDCIGTTRESLTVGLSSLRRAGLVEIDRRKIVVLDREGLAAVAKQYG